MIKWFGRNIFDFKTTFKEDVVIEKTIVTSSGASVTPQSSTNGAIIAGGATPAAVTGASLAGTDLDATTGDGTLVLDPVEELPPVKTPEEFKAQLEREARAAVEEDRIATREGFLGVAQSGVGNTLIADQEVWDNEVAEYNRSRTDRDIPNIGLSEEAINKNDVRRHLDAVFGIDTAGAADPTLGGLSKIKHMAEDAVVPNTPNDTARDLALKFHDNKIRVKGMVDKYQEWDKYTDNAPAEEVKEDLRKSLQESLKDFVNNQLFQGARDLGQSAEEAYNNPNVQIDEKNFVGLSQALLDEKANINQ